jgi:phage terminase large subunit-like protein
LIRASGVNYVDVEDVRRRWVELRTIYRVQQIAYDPWQARQVALRMHNEDKLPVVEVPQTMKHLSEPTKEFLRLLADGKLRFGDSPVLRWMASNLVLYRDGKANVVPQKQDKSAKVDGIVAALNAFARARLATTARKSATSQHGVVWV